MEFIEGLSVRKVSQLSNTLWSNAMFLKILSVDFGLSVLMICEISEVCGFRHIVLCRCGVTF